MLIILYINAQQMHVSGTLLNWAQDTGILLKSSEMSGWSKNFWARKWWLYMSKRFCVCTSDTNLLLRASHICFQDTRSGTMNGILFWNHHSTEHTLSICLQNTENGRQQEKRRVMGSFHVTHRFRKGTVPYDGRHSIDFLTTMYNYNHRKRDCL